MIENELVQFEDSMNSVVKKTASPMSVIEMALKNKDLDVGVLRELVGLQSQVNKEEAVKAYNSAYAGFRADCPIIRKDKLGGGVTKSGANFKFPYSSPEQIAKTIAPLLERWGLSYRWKSKMSKCGKFLITRCVIKHSLGHEEYSDVPLPITGEDPIKFTALQGRARRTSLINGLGIICENEHTSFDEKEIELVTGEQARIIKSMLEDSGVDEGKFFDFIGTESIEMMARSTYRRAFTVLTQKIKERNK